MAEIDTPMPVKQPPPETDKRENRATVCALLAWVVVFFVSQYALTLEYPLETMSAGELITLLLILLISLFVYLLSIYKIARALLNLYKHR